MWREERGERKEEREMRKVEREKRNEESGMRILRLLSWKKLVISFLFPLSSFLYFDNANAQTVMDLIREKPQYASCNYNTYPDTIKAVLTPAPAGKKPFYMSHYGRHGSRYISSRTGYDTPYDMMNHADSVDELTPTGHRVLEEMRLVMDDTEKRNF